MENKCQNCPNSDNMVRVFDHVNQAGAYRFAIIGVVVTVFGGMLGFMIGYGEQKMRVAILVEQVNRIERNMPYVERKITDGRQMEGQTK